MGTRPIRTVIYKGQRIPISQYLELERARVKEEFSQFTNAFSSLEYALSGLLHATLGTSINDRIPYAIYYSVNSFDARVSIVENALTEAISQNPMLKPLAAKTHWPFLAEKFRTIRVLRNAIAHGSLQNLEIRGKVYVRWVSPASDVIRIGRILAKHQIPGLTSEDIGRGRKLLWPVIECVNDLNLLLRASRREKTAWETRYAQLEEHLDAVRNLYPGGQTKDATESSEE